jgi:hypothetical protein
MKNLQLVFEKKIQIKAYNDISFVEKIRKE